MDEIVTLSNNNIIDNGIISKDLINPYLVETVNVQHLEGMIDIVRTRNGILNHILCLLRSMDKIRCDCHQ